MSGFCRWYGKDMEDVTEHEQEQCEENGQDCRECPDLVIKEQEAAGHESVYCCRMARKYRKALKTSYTRDWTHSTHRFSSVKWNTKKS